MNLCIEPSVCERFCARPRAHSAISSVILMQLPPSVARPLVAKVAVNRPLCTEGYERDVRHLEIDLTASGIKYAAGDVLGMLPLQAGLRIVYFFFLVMQVVGRDI